MAMCAAVTQSHALQAEQETNGCLRYLILTPANYFLFTPVVRGSWAEKKSNTKMKPANGTCQIIISLVLPLCPPRLSFVGWYFFSSRTAVIPNLLSMICTFLLLCTVFRRWIPLCYHLIYLFYFLAIPSHSLFFLCPMGFCGCVTYLHASWFWKLLYHFIP